ncbi:MAG: hypothetical protein M0Z66_16020 [Thermaerobacter sp.]|nr:hypothetical protein [Thermaerobacter sp.]
MTPESREQVMLAAQGLMMDPTCVATITRDITGRGTIIVTNDAALMKRLQKTLKKAKREGVE